MCGGFEASWSESGSENAFTNVGIGDRIETPEARHRGRFFGDYPHGNSVRPERDLPLFCRSMSH
jgi:hypothetical protein